jgi:hypothetical protein
MAEKKMGSRFRVGVQACWLSILATPVGLLAIGGGPCAGPNNTAGSIILLSIGMLALGGAIFGTALVLIGVRAEDSPIRLFGALSVCVAIMAGLVGGIYLFIGYASATVFLRS